VLLSARIVDSWPPCVVIEEVNAVPTRSVSFALLPQASGLIHELLQLRGDVAEPRWGVEPSHPRGALPEVEVRDEQTRRPSVLGVERLVVVLVGDPRLSPRTSSSGRFVV
jgi:hypothetical protein